jgi:D-inositol-3-phosphate glycosyltransferase
VTGAAAPAPGRGRGEQPRVIHLADYGGPYAGSFVPMLAAAAREATRRGYETTIFLSEIGRGRPWLSELEGLAEVRWLARGATRTRTTRSTLKALESELATKPGPAVLHSHFGTFDIPAVLMRLRRRRVAVFWHEHTRPLTGPREKRNNAARYSALGPLVDRILCVSPEILSALRARRAPARKLLYFPNAIDLQRFSPITPSDRLAARRSLSLPEPGRIVLHFGWDWYRKGGDLMLGAAELLGPEPDLGWLTVLGDQVPAEMRDNPEAHPAVRALGPTSEVRQLYAASDLLLSCSRGEGMPYAVLEALACGLPVVGTDLAVQQHLLNGLTGARVVPAEPRAIADGVRDLLAVPEAGRLEHAAQARARVEASYSLDAWARRLVDLYAEALPAEGRTANPG